MSDRLYTVKPLPAGAYEIEASRFARELFEYYEYCVVNDPTKLDEIRAWTATILAAPGPQPIPQLAASGREWAAAREWAARIIPRSATLSLTALARPDRQGAPRRGSVSRYIAVWILGYGAGAARRGGSKTSLPHFTSLHSGMESSLRTRRSGGSQKR